MLNKNYTAGRGNGYFLNIDLPEPFLHYSLIHFESPVRHAFLELKKGVGI